MHQSKQNGFTLIGLILILALIGIITLSVIKVFPVYMEHLSVKTSMEAVQADHNLKKMSVGQIRALFEKKLDMNQVRSINAKNAKIGRGIGEITFKIEYEVRKEYIGNIDIVLSFSDQFEVQI